MTYEHLLKPFFAYYLACPSPLVQGLLPTLPLHPLECWHSLGPLLQQCYCILPGLSESFESGSLAVLAQLGAAAAAALLAL
jgi:hypothetical protein